MCFLSFRRLNFLLFACHSSLITALFSLFSTRLSYHTGFLFGVLSVLWSGHIAHSLFPVSRGVYLFIFLFKIFSLKSILCLDWCFYVLNFDLIFHLFGYSAGSGFSLLSLICRLSLFTGSLYLSDICHHHLSLGVILIIFSVLFKFWRKGLSYLFINLVKSTNSYLSLSYIYRFKHFEISLLIGLFGILSFCVAFIIFLYCPYVYLSYDLIFKICLYIHHQYISSLLEIGSFYI